MSDLTISKLIKLIIAGVVLVVVILGLYFAITSYVIPFFKGLGFGGGEIGGEILGEASICEGKTFVGFLEKDGDLLYFNHEGERTKFYIRKNKIYKSKTGFDQKAGEVVDGKIIIFNEILTWYRELPFKTGSDEDKEFKQLLDLEHSVIGGLEVCKL